jgi:hypothetical protein
MTLELHPSLIFFGDNSDPFGGAGSTGQEPLLKIEGHVTRNLNSTIWVSLDGLYEYGGETSTDGASNNDVQESFGLGVTANFTFSPSFSVKASYGNNVYSNQDGGNGHAFRVISSFVF